MLNVVRRGYLAVKASSSYTSYLKPNSLNNLSKVMTRSTFASSTSSSPTKLNSKNKAKAFSDRQSNLMAQVMGCTKIHAVSTVYRKNRKQLNPQLFRLILHKMSSLGLKTADEKRALKGIIGDINYRLEEFNSFELAESIRFIATMGYKDHAFYEAVAAHLKNSVNAKGMASRSIHNFIYSFAKVGFRDQTVIDNLWIEMEKVLDTFKPAELAVSIWGLAKIGSSRDVHILDKIAPAIDAFADSFSTNNLSSILWSYATLTANNAFVFEKLGARALQLANKGQLNKPSDIAKIVWAHGKFGIENEKLFDKLGPIFTKYIDGFNPQEISMIVHGLSKTGYYNEDVFTTVENELSMSSECYKSMELANILYAFAKLGKSNSTVFEIFNDRLKFKVDSFNVHELTIAAWVYATVQYTEPQSMKLIAAELVKNITELHSYELASVCYSYGSLSVDTKPLVESLVQQLFYKIPDMKPQELAMISRGLASVYNEFSRGIFANISVQADTCISEFKPQEIVDLMWSSVVSKDDALLMLTEGFHGQIDMDFVSNLSADRYEYLFEALLDLKLKQGDEFALDEEVVDYCRKEYIDNTSLSEQTITKQLEIASEVKSILSTAIHDVQSIETRVQLDCGYCADLFIERVNDNSNPIVVQLCLPGAGIHHLSEKVDSHVMLRNNHLGMMGFDTMTVSSSEWSKLDSAELQIRYLMSSLKKAKKIEDE